jgi:hypothetical protein
VRARRDGLDPNNQDAVRIFYRLARRFLVDAGLIPVALAAELADVSPSDQRDLLDRLSVLYDVLSPAKPVK